MQRTRGNKKGSLNGIWRTSSVILWPLCCYLATVKCSCWVALYIGIAEGGRKGKCNYRNVGKEFKIAKKRNFWVSFLTWDKNGRGSLPPTMVGLYRGEKFLGFPQINGCEYVSVKGTWILFMHVKGKLNRKNEWLKKHIRYYRKWHALLLNCSCVVKYGFNQASTEV